MEDLTHKRNLILPKVLETENLDPKEQQKWEKDFLTVVENSMNDIFDDITNHQTDISTAQTDIDAAEVRLDELEKPVGAVVEIDDSDSPYTIADDDEVACLLCDTGSGAITVNLPTLGDNKGRVIKIVNIDGTNDVTVAPEGSEKVNTYAADVEITEKWGWWEFRGATSQWVGTTDGYSTKVETTSTTSSTSHDMDLDETWDDDLSISIGVGLWMIYAQFTLLVLDATDGTYIRSFGGIGTLSGNDEPDINHGDSIQYTSTNESAGHSNPFCFVEEYEATAAKTIYIKARGQAQNGVPTTFRALGTSGMYRILNARRIA